MALSKDKQLIAFAVKKDVYKALVEEADAMDLSLSAYIRYLIANRKK